MSGTGWGGALRSPSERSIKTWMQRGLLLSLVMVASACPRTGGTDAGGTHGGGSGEAGHGQGGSQGGGTSSGGGATQGGGTQGGATQGGATQGGGTSSGGTSSGGHDSAQFAGTTGKSEGKSTATGKSQLTDARVGGHDGFDRVVFEFQGKGVPAYTLEYLKKPLTHCSSGEEVKVSGGAVLSVRFSSSAAHAEDGSSLIKSRDFSPGLSIIKQATLLCDFEGSVQWVLGVGAAHPYRVMVYQDPARLVVDIKHQP